MLGVNAMCTFWPSALNLVSVRSLCGRRWVRCLEDVASSESPLKMSFRQEGDVLAHARDREFRLAAETSFSRGLETLGV